MIHMVAHKSLHHTSTHTHGDTNTGSPTQAVVHTMSWYEPRSTANCMKLIQWHGCFKPVWDGYQCLMHATILHLLLVCLYS